MRQNENNPIIYLSQQVLAGKELHVGDYGSSSIISKNSISKEHFTKANICKIQEICNFKKQKGYKNKCIIRNTVIIV